MANSQVTVSPMVSKKRKSVEDLVDDPKEADRVLSYVTGNRATREHVITDFSSFKEAFRDAFMKEGSNSHARLWDTLGGQDDLLLKLYGQTSIQDKVTRDSRESRVADLMGRFGVPKQIANQMFAQARENEIRLVRSGQLPSTETVTPIVTEFVSPAAPTRGIRISQVTKTGGRIYQRSKPARFSIPQQRFLRNNASLSTKKLTEEFNTLFRENRSLSSIYTKKFRLSKETPNS